jgi:hypothetical protein
LLLAYSFERPWMPDDAFLFLRTDLILIRAWKEEISVCACQCTAKRNNHNCINQITPSEAMDNKCLRCGGSNFQPGAVQSTGSIFFVPDNTKFLSALSSDVSLKSRICMDCGTLDMVGDTKKVAALVGADKAA